MTFLQDMERAAYIAGCTDDAARIAELIDAQRAAEAASDLSAHLALQLVEERQAPRHDGLDPDHPVFDRFDALVSQLELIAQAVGAARPCALKRAIQRKVSAATRARIDLQDALREVAHA